MSRSAEKAAQRVRALHQPVQWTGWRLWISRIAHDPLAYCDRWCRECRKPWPCPTAQALTTPPEKEKS